MQPQGDFLHLEFDLSHAVGEVYDVVLGNWGAAQHRITILAYCGVTDTLQGCSAAAYMVTAQISQLGV